MTLGLFIRGLCGPRATTRASRLGSCTSFVNLLDMCAIMVPEVLRPRLLRVPRRAGPPIWPHGKERHALEAFVATVCP